MASLRTRRMFTASRNFSSRQFVRREIITLLQISHPSIVPLIGVASDEHHPLALLSPYYRNGHALGYLKKLAKSGNSHIHVAAALRIVSDLCPLGARILLNLNKCFNRVCRSRLPSITCIQKLLRLSTAMCMRLVLCVMILLVDHAHPWITSSVILS